MGTKHGALGDAFFAHKNAKYRVLIYRKNSFSLDEYYCFDEDDDYMLQLRRSWETKLREAIAVLSCLDKGLIRPMRVAL